MKRDIELCRQLLDKPRILFGVIGTNPVLQMRDFEPKSKLFTQLMKKMQQRHRIRPAGHGDKDSLAWRKQVKSLNRRLYVLNDAHCRQEEFPDFSRLNQLRIPPPIKLVQR